MNFVAKIIGGWIYPPLMEITKDTPKEDIGEYEISLENPDNLGAEILDSLGVWKGDLEGYTVSILYEKLEFNLDGFLEIMEGCMMS